MKLQFWSVGKVHEPYVKEGIEIFTKRISHYFNVEWRIIPSIKNGEKFLRDGSKKAESENILKILQPEDVLIVLDEKGKQISSEQLAELINQYANKSSKNLIFLIGGAYGIDEIILKKAAFTWSLSQLVFPHQLVRLILAEQTYRACTILRHEKYHHS